MTSKLKAKSDETPKYTYLKYLQEWIPEQLDFIEWDRRQWVNIYKNPGTYDPEYCKAMALDGIRMSDESYATLSLFKETVDRELADYKRFQEDNR